MGLRKCFPATLGMYLAVAMLCLSAFPFAFPNPADRAGATNCCELQRLLVALLTQTAQAGTDVNGDGRHDILDLQRLVHQATGKNSAPQPEPSESMKALSDTSFGDKSPLATLQGRGFETVTQPPSTLLMIADFAAPLPNRGCGKQSASPHSPPSWA